MASRPTWSSASKRARQGCRGRRPDQGAVGGHQRHHHWNCWPNRRRCGRERRARPRCGWVPGVRAVAPQTPLSSGIRTQAGSPGRADHELGAVEEGSETDPVQARQRVVDQRGQVGGVGDAVAFAVQQRARVPAAAVLLGFAAASVRWRKSSCTQCTRFVTVRACTASTSPAPTPASARRIPARRCCTALRARGLRATGMKPVASGCERIDGAWKNADALALLDASDPRPTYADCNPFALSLPLAPELAARDAGVDVGLQAILDAHARSPHPPTRWWSKASRLGRAAVVVADAGRPGARAGACRSCSSSDCAWLPQPRAAQRARHRRRRLPADRLDRERDRSAWRRSTTTWRCSLRGCPRRAGDGCRSSPRPMPPPRRVCSGFRTDPTSGRGQDRGRGYTPRYRNPAPFS